MFYPSDPDDLRSLLADCFRDARSLDDLSVNVPKALIAPHAGYIYSGPIAASAYQMLEAARGTVTKVVLLGPSHRVPLEGLAVPSVEALATPLGVIALDPTLRELALALPGVVTADGPHAAEHSLEVHLPFIEHVLGDVTVLPLVVGHASTELVAAVLDAVWGGPETLIVISTDLSHYHDYATAKRLDRATADAVEEGRPDKIDDLDACGAYPLRGLLHAAGRRGTRATVIDLRNSGDTAGSRDRVVGYGAFAVD
jgi:AmmeMemoRadiSam system protein B